MTSSSPRKRAVARQRVFHDRLRQTALLPESTGIAGGLEGDIVFADVGVLPGAGGVPHPSLSVNSTIFLNEKCKYIATSLTD